MTIQSNEESELPLKERVNLLEQTVTGGRTSVDNMATDFDAIRRDMAMMKAEFESSRRWARRYRIYITVLLILGIIALGVDIYHSVYGF